MHKNMTVNRFLFVFICVMTVEYNDGAEYMETKGMLEIFPFKRPKKTEKNFQRILLKLVKERIQTSSHVQPGLPTVCTCKLLSVYSNERRIERFLYI